MNRHELIALIRKTAAGALGSGIGLNALDEYEPTDGGMAAAINRTIDTLNARGGGLVVVPDMGTAYDVETTIILKSNVYLAGVGTPTLRLKNSVNKSVIESYNFQTLTGVDSSGGVSNCGLSDLIIDGNRVNNGSPGANEGHGVALFGRDIYLDDLEIINAARRGLHTEYGTGAVGISPFAGRAQRLLMNSTGEEGWFNKISDLHADDINIRSAGLAANNTYDALVCAASGGIRGANINIWTGGSDTSRPRYGVRVDGGGTTLSNIHIETAATAALILNQGRCSVAGLYSYNILGAAHIIIRGNGNKVEGVCEPAALGLTTSVPLVLGETGDTVLGNSVDLVVMNFTGTVIDPTYSGGGNRVTVSGYQGSGQLWTVNPPAGDFIQADISGLSKTVGGRAPGSSALGPGSSATAVGAAAVGNNALASGVVAVALGNNVTASATASLATGTRAVASLYGGHAHSAGRFAADGDSQCMDLQWRATTTDATPTEGFLDNSAVRALMPANTSWTFDILIAGRTTSGGSERFSRRILGMINIGASAGTVNLPASNVVTDINIPVGFDATATADTTNGSLKLEFTGAASRTVRWLAVGRLVQVSN